MMLIEPKATIMKTSSSRTEKKRRKKMMEEVDELTCLLGIKQ